MTITSPQPIRAGEEMRRLARFHRDVRWTGTVRAGGMGPGSPEMTAIGEGRHHTIQNGLWIVGDYQQDQYLADETFVQHWELHWVAGWDPQAGEYRASAADNYGHLELLAGSIDGRLLTFRSIGNPPVRLQLFWHIVDDNTMTWRNEISVDGGAFQLVERYDCTTIR
ncbi:DUF1579 family protein [Kribbella sp. NPDC048928]|uniref:DUF1579 family protein n=1 Tax=Kribbella sp. NPDC048928 TaxID=3364111 RepID=UPI0037230C1C